MPSPSADSKTEKATPKKREDEQKKGNIFQSADVVSAVSVLSVFVIIKLLLPFGYRYFSNFMIQCFGNIKTMNQLDQDVSLGLLNNVYIMILILSLPPALAAVLASIITTGAQTKFKFSHEKIKFKLSNISPLKGFKRMFSLRSIVELLKSSIKIIVIGYIMYVQIKKIVNQCILMMYGDIIKSTITILNDIMNLVIQMSLVFIGIAALDYFYQWWDYERNIRMSKQEIKEEYKEMEGNPEIKGRIKQLQRKMANQRMMQKVPSADVVVRNPTHFAIALKYNSEKDNAPVVVAKGQDYVALKIIKIAEQYKIPMKEDIPLAHALYASVEVGMEIPPEFYNALAEIMAWVYKQKRR